jgi:hypothetical protein
MVARRTYATRPLSSDLIPPVFPYLRYLKQRESAYISNMQSQTKHEEFIFGIAKLSQNWTPTEEAKGLLILPPSRTGNGSSLRGYGSATTAGASPGFLEDVPSGANFANHDTAVILHTQQVGMHLRTCRVSVLTSYSASPGVDVTNQQL